MFSLETKRKVIDFRSNSHKHIHNSIWNQRKLQPHGCNLTTSNQRIEFTGKSFPCDL